jgi:hypothetical protein
MINKRMDQTPTVVFDSHFIDCNSNGLQPVTFAAAAAGDDDDDDNGNDALQSNIS